MKSLTILLCVLASSLALADYANEWRIDGDKAESLIESIAQVVTVQKDDLGQAILLISNIYCLVGGSEDSASYSCRIDLEFDKMNFEGKVAEKIYNQLLESDAPETMQTGGTSIEVKDIDCMTIVKNHGSGDYLSSLCRGEKVSVQY